MKINKVDSTFNFNLLDLEDPKGVQGGSHVAKIKLDKDEFFIKTGKCISRNGIVTNGRKQYIDLMFSSSDNTFVEWVEKLEESLQKKIYEKSSEWFENELNPDDIENSFLASLKPFRSGKFYLLRCNLSPISQLTPTSGIKIYDEEGNDLNVDDVKENKKMICIININVIRFSSKNFQVDYYIKQIMILNDVNINNEKLLLLGDKTVPNIVQINTKKEELTDNKNNDIDDEYHDDINESNKREKTYGNHVKDDNNVENAVIEDSSNVLGESNNQDKTITVDISNIELNDLLDVSNDELIDIIENPEKDTQDMEDKKSLEENIKTTILENQDVNENKLKDNGSLEDSELSLEDCEVNFDFTSTDKEEEIKLKNPKDVYIEIYKAARKKAKETREKAAQAFLEVHNIKNKYNLTDIFDSDEDDEEESYLSKF